jgi:lysozyme family protein
MRFEGVMLENVPGDSGLLTFCGISRHYNPNWPGWAIIDQYLASAPDFHAAGHFAVQDQSLLALVEQFYKNLWNSHRLGELVSQELATQVYDAVVNIGDRAVKGLQGVLGIRADGNLGPITIQECNNPQGVIDQIINSFINWRKNYYASRVLEKPEKKKFLDDWLLRCVRSDSQV